MKGVDLPALQRLEDIDSDLLYITHRASDSIGDECPLHNFPQPGMILPLLKEDGSRPHHPLLARRECWLEEVGARYQHELRSLRAGHHHTGGAQDVGLKDGAISAS